MSAQRFTAIDCWYSPGHATIIDHRPRFRRSHTVDLAYCSLRFAQVAARRMSATEGLCVADVVSMAEYRSKECERLRRKRRNARKWREMSVSLF